MNNDSFVADSEEREWSSSDNSAIDYNENEQSGSISENEQSESTSDNDDGVFQFHNNEAKEVYVTETIREWALEGGVISMTKLNNLLLRLRVVHPTLPKNYKSLLKTSSHLNIIETDQAEIWYKGIRFNLDAMLLEEYLETYHQICIDVNMDGLPISKSSPLKFWPILGRLIDSENEPFVISIYFGRTDPTDVRSFLNNFVNEVEDLFQNGYTFNEITYPFVIRNFILDAPARSLVKCCIGHGGYGSCEKCTVIGETVHSRRVYLELDKPLRTDESFKNREQPLHYCGQSPLEQIIGMVSQFRLDPFHLVWHGVFKRLLEVWHTWNGPWKLYREIRWDIYFLLLSLAGTCPRDFVRKPRSLKEWRTYKATEERRLCLYDGIVVFKDNLEENVYHHFLMLHGALTILSSPMLVQSEIMCHYSNDLLRAFINHSIVIYGKTFVVYNVHSLSHLAQECLSHGSLDKFSAFPFENFLKSLKSLLKSGYKPLQQAARRDLEKTVSVSVHLPTKDKEVSLSHRHYCDGEIIEGSYFRSISIGNVVLQFVVLKFAPDDVDNDNIYYDIGLTKWLIEVNEDMEDSDEDEEKRVKKSTKAVVPPPNVPPPLPNDFYNTVPTCSHGNESQKKKLDIKVNLRKSRKIPKQQTPSRSNVKEKTLLVQNVLDARKRATEQLQKKLCSQSLSSNKVTNASNSEEFLKKQSQEHQTELQMQTERSKCNKQTLSEDNEVTKKNNNKFQQSEKFLPSLSNIEKNSDFEDSVDFTSSTEDSVANDTTIKEHVDIPSKAASNLKHMELSQVDENIDKSQNSSSTTSERKNKMQDLKFHLSDVDRKLLEEISHKIDTVITNQGKLNRCLLPQEKKIVKPHNMPSLPFRNESDVQAMEKWLCDSENKIALCDYLTSFGSASDERKTATIIMQKLMYNSLAKNYNFDGHGEKRGLKTLQL
ncbi:uncharacterized protein [Temnothorax longispinosus]|uniref:uncharacterized protein isoform X4 n=1 Tax=Temnothorax longispinosus TaxID=300112 RepID=UPI003A9948F0